MKNIIIITALFMLLIGVSVLQSTNQPDLAYVRAREVQAITVPDSKEYEVENTKISVKKIDQGKIAIPKDAITDWYVCNQDEWCPLEWKAINDSPALVFENGKWEKWTKKTSIKIKGGNFRLDGESMPGYYIIYKVK